MESATTMKARNAVPPSGNSGTPCGVVEELVVVEVVRQVVVSTTVVVVDVTGTTLVDVTVEV
jgi:hypothetical protein